MASKASQASDLIVKLFGRQAPKVTGDVVARTATRGGPRITGDVSSEMRGSRPIGSPGVEPSTARGGGVGPDGIAKGIAGAGVTALIADLLIDAVRGAGRTAVNQTTNPVPVGSQQTNKYTLPMDSPLAYMQAYNREMYNRALLESILGVGTDALGPAPQAPLSQTEAFDLNQIATARAGEREREIARIQGELAALPAAFQSQGRVADATSNALQSAIATVLQRAPIEKSEALRSIATVNQFSN
jgi:hypothetical protein